MGGLRLWQYRFPLVLHFSITVFRQGSFRPAGFRHSYVDRRISASPPLHIRGDGSAHHHSYSHHHPAHPGRHFPRNQYSRCQRDMELHRPGAERDGGPDRGQLRARIHGHGQRHRTPGIAVAERNRRDQDIFPAFRQHFRSADASDGDLPDRATGIAPGHDPATDHHLHRILDTHCATGLEQQDASGTAVVRFGAEFSAHAVNHSSGRSDSISLRRQAAPGAGGPRFRQTPGLWFGTRGYRQRGGRAELDSAGRHHENRAHRVQRGDERHSADRPRTERSAGEDFELVHSLPARCGACTRWICAANQHRAAGRGARRADVDLQAGRSFHADGRQCGEGDCAAGGAISAARA